MIEEVKFAYPGIYPGNIEFSKTRAEADNELMNGAAYIGTRYPMKLTLDNFVKFYWRTKRIAASASMTQLLDQEGYDLVTHTTSLVDSEMIIVDLNGNELSQTTSLETLESRSCLSNFNIKYIVEQVSEGPVASASVESVGYLSQFFYDEYSVIAELRGGSASDLNNYDFYPRMDFGMGCGYDFSYATHSATQGFNFDGPEVTVGVNMDGVSVSEITLYGTSYEAAGSETYSFPDWNIELWPTLELE
jgi:hypothetical protein